MSNPKMVKSVRNEQVAEVVFQDSEKAVILMQDTGEEKEIKLATFKRWWKEIPSEGTEAPAKEVSESTITPNKTSKLLMREPGQYPADPEPEKEVEEIIPDVVIPTSETKITKTVKEPKQPKKEKPDTPKIDPENLPLKRLVEKIAEELGTEVFVPSVKNFRSIKVDGKMYMAFTFNKKDMTLWLRSKAIGDIAKYKKTQHMFDARIKIDNLDARIENMIRDLMKASKEYQVNKMAEKAAK